MGDSNVRKWCVIVDKNEAKVTFLKDRFRNDLLAVMNNFQAEQRNAAQKEKASMQRAQQIQSNSFDDEFGSQPTTAVSEWELLSKYTNSFELF